MRSWPVPALVFVTGLVFGVVTVISCSLEQAGSAGDANGTDSTGSSTSSLGGSTVVTAECALQTSGGYAWKYTAEVSVPGLDPSTAPHVSIMSCDLVNLAAGDYPCVHLESYALGPGKVFVVCGGHGQKYAQTIKVRVN